MVFGRRHTTRVMCGSLHPIAPVWYSCHTLCDACRYEVLAKLGGLLMSGGVGLERDYATAAKYLNEAAEAAEMALKPKHSMKYFELAAEAEGMME